LLELDAGTAAELASLGPDVVFPALHGPPGEDGTVQGFLEILGFPYVGGGVRASAVAMDKALAKTIFREQSLPVADHVVVAAGTDVDLAAASIRDQLGETIVIKPLGQGSALGVSLLANGGDARPALIAALDFGEGALVEPYVLGDEITVGVLDLAQRPVQAFPVIEIRTAVGEWYDYTNRYAAGKSEHIIPAPLPDDVSQRLQEIAVRAHECLGLNDLSRADFIVTAEHEIFLLEVNSLPGMTPTSLFPDGARAMGLSFPALMDALVESAVRRHRAR
jgi:D-alanine-D-alanine ligase